MVRLARIVTIFSLCVITLCNRFVAGEPIDSNVTNTAVDAFTENVPYTDEDYYENDWDEEARERDRGNLDVSFISSSSPDPNQPGAGDATAHLGSPVSGESRAAATPDVSDGVLNEAPAGPPNELLSGEDLNQGATTQTEKPVVDVPGPPVVSSLERKNASDIVAPAFLASSASPQAVNMEAHSTPMPVSPPVFIQNEGQDLVPSTASLNEPADEPEEEVVPDKTPLPTDGATQIPMPGETNTERYSFIEPSGGIPPPFPEPVGEIATPSLDAPSGIESNSPLRTPEELHHSVEAAPTSNTGRSSATSNKTAPPSRTAANGTVSSDIKNSASTDQGVLSGTLTCRRLSNVVFTGCLGLLSALLFST